MNDLAVHDQELVKRVLSDWKLTPATFAHRISGGSWIPAPHLQYISLKIAKAIAKGNGRIIISAPPRHGKSELCSVYTPAWVLERFPQYKVILTGYGADLVTGFSRRVRDMFVDQENQQILDTRVRRDSSRVEAFLTESAGGMYSIGVGGAITGRGANVLLIDDYIKEIKEALSPTYRDYIWNWFVTTAFTRLEPGGTCIIIATRWHSDDLIGRILKEFPGMWDYIEIPALAEAGDVLGRDIGEPLFPERYDYERLMELKETLGSIFFQALFQQKPVDESEKLTDRGWFAGKILNELPAEARVNGKKMRIWDLAATNGGGDMTVGSLLNYTKSDGRVIIENIIRGQFSPEKVEQKVAMTAQIDGRDVKIGIEQEPGSSGKALIDHFMRNVVPGFTVVPIPATQKKLVRAQPFLAGAEAGKVYLMAGVWNEAFLREFDDFPGGAFDDQVDTVGAGYEYLTGKKLFTASWGRNKQLQDLELKHKSTTGRTKKMDYRDSVKARFAMAARDPSRGKRVTFGR